MGKASNISVEQVKKWFSNRRMRESNTKHLSQISARRKRVRTEGWLLTRESLPKLLLYMVVSASGELRKIKECCNSVDKL